MQVHDSLIAQCRFRKRGDRDRYFLDAFGAFLRGHDYFFKCGRRAALRERALRKGDFSLQQRAADGESRQQARNENFVRHFHFSPVKS